MSNLLHMNPPKADAADPHSPKSKRRLTWPVVLSGLSLFVAGSALTLGLVNYYHTSRADNWQDYAQLIPSHSQGADTELTNRALKAGAQPMFSGSANLIADVAEAIAPSVVNIDTQRTGRPITAMPLQDEFFGRFFGLPSAPFQQRIPVIKGNGSGVIISAEGHVLTNNHVVTGADEIMVTLNDRRKFKARVIGRDPFSDIAVVKMEGATNLKPAKLGTTRNLRPGEWVIAVGSPLGFDHTVTVGIVSALSRQVPDINANVDFIQTDAAINPGNSGGPLVNLNGEVIGINTAIAGQGQNIGFAIPVDVAKNVSQDLLQNGGKITRPWIGISMAELNPELAKGLGIPENVQGVIVAQVMPGSPSFKAGFQQGDIIQRINGQMVKTPKQIQDLVRAKPLNSELSFQILRNGQMNAVMLKTEALPDSAFARNEEAQ